ncbi:universal stress protein [Streptomyces sp. AcE210]|nr:universal stress protein [Streptomyces sp. AcE210]
MSPTVTVGLDGSAGCRAAAEWVAHEAMLRDARLKTVLVREPEPVPVGGPSARQGPPCCPQLGSAALHRLRSGRRLRCERTALGRGGLRSALGTHIGPVTHAVLHHAIAPVAVVLHE